MNTHTGDLVALPVVGDSGIVLSALSASDLRSITKLTLSVCVGVLLCLCVCLCSRSHISHTHTQTLLLPVLEYLTLTHGGLRSAVTCRPGDTLGDALKKILQGKVRLSRSCVCAYVHVCATRRCTVPSWWTLACR